MKIRFSEHITLSHREGILNEIAEMGATPEQLDADAFLLRFPNPGCIHSSLNFCVKSNTSAPLR